MKLSKTNLAAAAVVGFGLVMAAPSQAGPAGEALSKCLVEKTNSDDRAVLAQWIFAVMSVHPSVKHMVNMDDAQRTEINRAGGTLITRLMSTDCGVQTRAALAEEGEEGFSNAFEDLGGMAMLELMGDPGVAASMDDMMEFVDGEAIAASLFASPAK